MARTPKPMWVSVQSHGRETYVEVNGSKEAKQLFAHSKRLGAAAAFGEVGSKTPTDKTADWINTDRSNAPLKGAKDAKPPKTEKSVKEGKAKAKSAKERVLE